MYVGNRETRDDGMGFIATAIGLAISAASAANSAGLFSGKVHTSPWGFVYDEYPLKIYEAEVALKDLQDAINQMRGLPPTADLPPPPTRTGGPQYQAAMLAIVPKYAPGWEDEIAAYNRTLNEPGGGYEIAYGKQQEKLSKLIAEGKALQLQATASPAPLRPDLYQPAVPVGGVAQPSPYAPNTSGVGTPYIYGAQQRPPLMQAGMLGLPSNMTPVILGGLAFIAVAAVLMDKKSGGSTNTRQPPRR